MHHDHSSPVIEGQGQGQGQS